MVQQAFWTHLLTWKPRRPYCLFLIELPFWDLSCRICFPFQAPFMSPAKPISREQDMLIEDRCSWLYTILFQKLAGMLCKPCSGVNCKLSVVQIWILVCFHIINYSPNDVKCANCANVKYNSWLVTGLWKSLKKNNLPGWSCQPVLFIF